jgi:hypothetical protein
MHHIPNPKSANSIQVIKSQIFFSSITIFHLIMQITPPKRIVSSVVGRLCEKGSITIFHLIMQITPPKRIVSSVVGRLCEKGNYADYSSEPHSLLPPRRIGRLFGEGKKGIFIYEAVFASF